MVGERGRLRARARMRRPRRGGGGCGRFRGCAGCGRGTGGRVLAAAARSRPRARGAPAAARAAGLSDRCAAMAGPPGQSRGAWGPLLLLLLAGPAACAASPGDDGAGPGGRGPRGRVRSDAGADETVRRHDSSYGTFAGEFYDLRYLSEEGEAGRVPAGGRGHPGRGPGGGGSEGGGSGRMRTEAAPAQARPGRERSAQTPSALRVGRLRPGEEGASRVPRSCGQVGFLPGPLHPSAPPVFSTGLHPLGQVWGRGGGR